MPKMRIEASREQRAEEDNVLVSVPVVRGELKAHDTLVMGGVNTAIEARLLPFGMTLQLSS